MLAILGFLTVASVLAVFAYSFNRLVGRIDPDLRLFGAAFGLVGAAFLFWGLVSLSGVESALPASVLLGEGLLVAATICMVNLHVPARHRSLTTIILAAGGLMLLALRITHYHPVPYMADGLLHFNIQHPVAIALSLLVIFGWLPACLRVARTVTYIHGLDRYRALYALLYVATAVSALLFIEAQRPSIIIASFSAFGAAILLLLLSNLLIHNFPVQVIAEETDAGTDAAPAKAKPASQATTHPKRHAGQTIHKEDHHATAQS